MKTWSDNNNWPEYYRIAATELLEELHELNTLDEKTKELQNFINKFTAVPCIWTTAVNICFKHQKIPDDKEIAYKKMLFSAATFHLMDERWEEVLSTLNKKVFGKLIESQNPNFELKHDTIVNTLYSLSECEKMVQYPNGRAESCFDFYCKNSTKPVSAELRDCFVKSQKIYKNIIQLEDNFEDCVKWLELLKETNDIYFIVQNVEKQLGNYPWHKKLWESYLKFLEENELKDLMLCTYARYCKLFINDFEMRKRFQNSIEKVPSKNLKCYQLKLIKIEKNFGSWETAAKLLQQYFFNDINEIATKTEFEKFFKMADETVIKLGQSSLMIKYLEEDHRISICRKSEKHVFKFSMAQKNLPFSSVFIYSILKKANYNILQKLYSSSKYFYAVFKAPLCYKIIFGKNNTASDNSSDTVSFENTLFISSNDLAPIQNINKIYLKEALIIKKACPSFSQIISKIFKCEIRFFEIFEQEMKLNEFEFLAKHVENLNLTNASILDESNHDASIPEIIEVMEKVEKAILHYGPTTTQSKFLTKSGKYKMKHKNTLKTFTFSSTETFNDPLVMCSFIQENAAPQASFFFTLNHGTDDERDNCIAAFQEMAESWLPVSEKPKIFLKFENPVEEFEF